MAIGLVFALASPANAVTLNESINDRDFDNYENKIEDKLGSDRQNAESTPEHNVVRPITPLNGQGTVQMVDSCRDGVDNDLDGLVDEANDPGCAPAPVATNTFPASAGETAVAVRLVTKGLLVNAGSVGKCASDFDGIGVAVIKNDPAAGTNPDSMPIEVTALQVQGTSEIIDDNPEYPDNPAAGNQNGPTPPYEPTECSLSERGEFPPPADAGFRSTVDVIQDPQAGFQTFGSFDDNNPGDVTLDFPATSTINAKTLTYPVALQNTVKAAGAPLVHNNITQFPPYCTANCNVVSTDEPFGAGADCYVGTDAKGALCIIEPQGPPPTAAVDHFKLYRTMGARITKASVNVEDEFDTGGPESTEIVRGSTLGNPTDKNGEGTLNDDNHLRCYKTKAPKFAKKTVISHDQFGYQRIELKKPAELCMSAEKSPHAAPVGEDNFQCYTPSTKTKLGPATVTVSDQFGSQTGVVVALKPKLWCAPADVNGSGIPDPDAHLTCYRISGGTPKIAPQLGLTVNPVGTPDPPFATETLHAIRATQLCTPTVRMS